MKFLTLLGTGASPDAVQRRIRWSAKPKLHFAQAFRDYEKGDFRLKPGSPAIGKGIDGENIGAIGSAVLNP